MIRYKFLIESDLVLVKEIYDYYILHTTVTFRTKTVSIEELKKMIPINHLRYKSYLIYYRDQIAGYCYLSAYKNIAAYDRTAEVAVYMKPQFTGKGIGKDALEKLEKDAFKSNFYSLIAIISGDNDASIKLFERSGFIRSAHYKNLGEKFDKIIDVIGYQKIIGH